VTAATDNQNVGASLADAMPVYVVDDNDQDRTEAARLAARAGLRVRTFGGGPEVMAVMDRMEPGIVMLDVMMPEVDGPEVLRSLTQREKGDVVIMMSAHGDVATAVAAMRHGAHDFLLKPLDEQGTLDTLERAKAALIDGRTAHQEQQRSARLLADITPKEMDVLRKLVAGKRNKTVAFELGVSERTVEVHRSRLIRRVDAGTFAGLISFAVKAGVEPDDA